ncbi:MAG: TIGR03862 family flavoprotein [Pseudorhodoplanes sp.]|nr:TIGR03862 family flavoprotein [Pseudorhodoplanes sp.]
MTVLSRAANTHHIAVIGGGPAGLMAADVLSVRGLKVTLFERMPSPARKLLLAGRGGLNLTHSEDAARFLTRYGAAAVHLKKAVEDFSPIDLRAFSESLGQPTFVGSSGRVFPQAMKASPLLRAWLRRLAGAGVVFALRHCWRGWDGEGRLVFETPEGTKIVTADATVLALGGASWPRLGSDGGWVAILREAGIHITLLRPANCGFRAAWSAHFAQRFAGAPLKRIALMFEGQSVRGEAIVTREGIEGGAVYALSAPLRDALAQAGEVVLQINLRPDLSREGLAQRLAAPRGKQSMANVLRKAAGLSPVAIGLVNEAVQGRTGQLSAYDLAALIKTVPVRLTATAPIERAISTAGGIAFEELDAHFMLRRRPGIFAAGEMLDWEAPTGGYLLQASFATGAAAARGVLHYLESRAARVRS